jgi:hypothetical protein
LKYLEIWARDQTLDCKPTPPTGPHLSDADVLQYEKRLRVQDVRVQLAPLKTTGTIIFFA